MLIPAIAKELKGVSITMSSMFIVGIIKPSFSSVLLASKPATNSLKSSGFPLRLAWSLKLRPDLSRQYLSKKLLASFCSRYSTILMCRMKSRLYTLQLRENCHRSSPQASFSGSLKISFSWRRRVTAVSRHFFALDGEMHNLQTWRSTNASGG